MGVDHGEVVGLAPAKQLGRGVEAFGIVEQVEVRQLLRRWKPILDEGVAHHSGTTAVASISTRADWLTSPLTSTSAIAG